MNTQKHANKPSKLDRLINVRFNYHPPLMRKLIRFKITTRNGIEWVKKSGELEKQDRSYKWLHWYWQPISEGGEYDCGFSSVREDHDDFVNLVQQLQTLNTNP